VEEGWDVRYLGWEDATKTPAHLRRFVERLVVLRAADLRIDLEELLHAKRRRLRDVRVENPSSPSDSLCS
jgi:hypothetical protein